MSAVTYLEAISQAIREEVRRDEAVFLLGEDVGTCGGAFKVSAGLLEEFGPERVIDTPMAEAAIIGSAVGAALMGMRPIAEMQFIDFITCGFDQIINMASKMYWRVGMPVPIVIRGPSGGGTHGGPFHSASPEAWFFHTPGVKVVDLRSLCPLDREAIEESVKRTNKVMIVHEDTFTGGVGAELAALLADDLFEHLDGPITRVAAPDAPFPYAPELEAAYLPD